MGEYEGIPCYWRGVRLRSLNEGKRACFMDQFGWSMYYESHTYCGYIPDFLFRHRVTRVVMLVEVKKYVDLTQLKNELICNVYKMGAVDYQYLVVGSIPDIVFTDDEGQEHFVEGVQHAPWPEHVCSFICPGIHLREWHPEDMPLVEKRWAIATNEFQYRRPD